MIRSTSRALSLIAPLLALAPACGGDEGRSTTDGLTSQTGADELDADAEAESEASDTLEGGVKLDMAASSTMGEADAEAETGECVAEMIVPEVQSVPVDVIIVVDTSNSMANAIAAVQASINTEFAQILESAGIDYRVVVLGDYPPGDQLSICIEPPLSGAPCNNPPAVPAITDVYKHYDAATGSGAFLNSIVGWYSTPDIHGLAPSGYGEFLRPEARKVFLAMTDGTSATNDTSAGDAFDAQLLALPGGPFGVPGDRKYVFHAIIEMSENVPPTEPWLPDDPIQGQGASIQHVAILSGGWRFPLALSNDFDVLFNEIATDVIDSTPLACEFAIPVPPEPLMIDPDTIQVVVTIGGVETVFHQVAGLGACEADAFYVENDTIHLCPQACTLVQSSPDAQIDLTFGCDVGFVE